MSGALLLAGGFSTQAQTQRRCGAQLLHENLIGQDPSWAQKFSEQRASLEACAQAYIDYKNNHAEKTTTVSAVPVIFHIVLDSAQFLQMGGATGIAKRCDSQIAVLNRDFNKHNADSTLIPANWKSLYGNAGISFGLALKSPTGACATGYEIKIISGSGFSDVNQSFHTAKQASTGLAAWDVTKYYNVWCINFTGSGSGLLGITVPKSMTGAGGFSVNDEGVCILYSSLGCTGPNSGVAPGSSSITYGTPPSGTGSYSGGGWFSPYNLGRTLTHETGHFFEIWHPWGDDGGMCSTWSSTATITGSGLISGEDAGITCTAGTGSDDGLSDTPPESDAVYGNPGYTITGGTTNDCCKMHGTTNTQPNGIACLSYMDYTDDDAMHMFTTMQASAMASMVLMTGSGTGATGTGTVGENYNLTQNPSLLVCPTTQLPEVPAGSSLNVYPNPTSGKVNISMNSAEETLQTITVLSITGQEVMKVKGEKQDTYTLDLTGMAPGLYIVKFDFANGSVTKKVTLQ